MKIQSVLLTDEDLRQAVSDYLGKHGVQLAVTRVEKAYGQYKEGYTYEAKVELEMEAEPLPPESEQSITDEEFKACHPNHKPEEHF